MVWDENKNSLLQFYKTDIAVGIAVNSSIAGSLLSADINLRFNAPLTEDIKVAAYILEDNIIAAQSNFYNDGRGNPIANFNHSAVLREMMSSAVLGDPVNTDGVTAGSNITINLSKTLNSSWVRKNCKVLVLLVKASNDQVITCQETAIGYGVGY